MCKFAEQLVFLGQPLVGFRCQERASIDRALEKMAGVRLVDATGPQVFQSKWESNLSLCGRSLYIEHIKR